MKSKCCPTGPASPPLVTTISLALGQYGENMTTFQPYRREAVNENRLTENTYTEGAIENNFDLFN